MMSFKRPIPGFVALAMLLGWYVGFVLVAKPPQRGGGGLGNSAAIIIEDASDVDRHRGAQSNAWTAKVRSSSPSRDDSETDNHAANSTMDGSTLSTRHDDETTPTPKDLLHPSVRAPNKSSDSTTTSADFSSIHVLGVPWDRNVSALPALRLAWIGDSLTRYQMLSLAYFLQSGSWFPDARRPNLVQKGGPGAATWNQFFNASSFLLGQAEGRHRCDCFRRDTDVFPNGRPLLERVFENRYFRTAGDDSGDDAAEESRHRTQHHLWYFNKCGNGSLQGHWTASEANAWHPPHAVGYDRLMPAAWSYSSWGRFIVEHLALLEPKPQYLVFNQGMWEDHDLNATVLDEIRHALHRVGIRGIYKTTTKRLIDNSTELLPHDALACQRFPCLDLSWTARLNASSFWDGRNHFVSSINTKFNQQLLELLRRLSLETESASSR